MQNPTPEQVKAARTAAGHSQTQAAETIYKGLRTWQQWEKGERAMDAALYEFYLIKTDQKYLNTEKTAISHNEMNLFRQWFDSVQDTNSEYLHKDDYVLAEKLYKELGIRVPNSITENLPK